MKMFLGLSLVAMVMGCGGGTPAEMTPEVEAELNAQMEGDMSSMTGELSENAPTSTTKAGKK
ncbi:MAG TPA: hypothetical protein EYG03_24925 [Planctomycetes bacterium]|nr:hypothetical protein [Fuerstiella sp.]HIK95199.1 hypothetical protein [Planctomycetota bacterium]